MIGRLSALTRKHAELDRDVKRETARPSADSLRLTDLKKRKLAVKDELNASQRRRRRHRNQDLAYPGLGV